MLRVCTSYFQTNQISTGLAKTSKVEVGQHGFTPMKKVGAESQALTLDTLADVLSATNSQGLFLKDDIDIMWVIIQWP